MLTTAFCEAVDAGAAVADHPAVKEAYEAAGGARRALVARSSSVIEDTEQSSMAGQFASVIGIDSFDDFVAAVGRVLGSREQAETGGGPMAILVQELVRPALGGVLFGVDPVTGRSDRRVVSAVRGGPEPLVSGQVEGSRYVLGPDGAVVESRRGDGPSLTRADLRRLVDLSNRVTEVFGGPQDVEWAIGAEGDEGEMWLLQSRPVTTEVRGVPRGPIYGPGPVAETFPEPLSQLEQDLWLPPLRDAVRRAVVLAGAATPAEVAASEVVVCVGGYVAMDLQLAGEISSRRSLGARLSLRQGLRRFRIAWRVGRLRRALPHLAEHLLDQADLDLQAVPRLSELTSRQLLALLHRSQVVLRALHAHEILMGLLTDTGGSRMTGASVALRVLAEARQDGRSDLAILKSSPIVLALTPPRVGPGAELPPEAAGMFIGVDGGAGNDNAIDREALRLRVRWVQELSGRAAWELGQRLSNRGELPAPEMISHMTLEQLEAVVTKRAAVVQALVAQRDNGFGPPLPARFQLSDLAKPIPVPSGEEVGSGTGAGGGVATGRVTYDTDDPPAGSVLVTTTLSPGLGPLLPRLRGIVAETGSVLSHLAILSREAGVPTVVGYADATRDLPEDAEIEVDGESGRVTILGKEEMS